MSLQVGPPRGGGGASEERMEEQVPGQGAADNVGLPQALEEALAFKHERAMQVGANAADADRLMAERQHEAATEDIEDENDENEVR